MTEQEILSKFKDFKFKVSETDKTNLKDFSCFKYRITITKDKLRRSFLYSVGIGHKVEDRINNKLIFGLISCFLSDLSYIDLEELKGLGYDPKEEKRVYKLVCEQFQKIKDLGILEILENLTEEEQEFLR